MDKTLNAFILAAGLGERLRPITYHIPKPLLPILGRPVLQSVVESVSNLPVNKIGINLHHKKGLVEDWINRSAFRERIIQFPEDPILGTGGALKNAEAFLGRGTFVVHNSDILTDMNLERLLEYHLSSGNPVTLAVHDCAEFNSLAIDEEGLLKGVGEALPRLQGVVKWVAFTGVAIYQPEFLKFLPAGVSSVVDAWLNAVSAGYRVGTWDVSGCYWSDIGTPSAYLSTAFDVLRTDGEMVYIHPSVEVCRDVDLNGYVVVEEGGILDRGVSLRNCIMLPGGRTERGSGYENCILGHRFRIDLNESEMPGFSGGDDAMLTGTGGSDRRYYRVKRDKGSVVLMRSADGDSDFERHIEYTRFFLKHSIPVPELIEVAPDNTRAVFEDLGDLSLYSWLKCPREDPRIEEMYRRVIDILVMLHTVATGHVSECPLLQDRLFDYEHLRWETGYFIESFVEGIRSFRVRNSSALEREFHRLALKVDSFPKSVIHRDFQSQNIMITEGGIPRLVDYQGARVGPTGYDLASILWDPYYRLESTMRERLIDYYMNEIRERALRETLLPCRLQRHMQALGAYGYLSAVKGKRYFLKYIPEGVRLLKEDLSLSKGEYPELHALVMGL